MTTTATTTTVATTQIRPYIQRFDFKPLFVDVLGWDNYKGQPVQVAVGAETYTLRPLVQKRGVVVLVCEPDARGGIPNNATRKKIDAEVMKLFHEHVIIYADASKTRQIWQWVKRAPGKPAAYREETYTRGQTGEQLAQRLGQLYIDLLEEETITLTGVGEHVQRAFDVDKVTKKFYDRFQKEHAAFLGAIEGVAAPGDREWYASLMLNRLMFSYFIQKKGFLDGDTDYLRHKLQQMRARFGADQFHTFYREFLLRFFHEGLGATTDSRSAEVRALIGKIPYLNGGLFEVHAIERANPEIAIPDAAFERVFNFFDAYSWHLDDRPTGADDEINPDVLGYIFEKYINQKQMGAYYTKEDITGYIGKNTILPFLLEAARKDCSIAFAPEGEVWRLPRDDPDRYIYEAVRKGVDIELPEDIAAGSSDVARRGGWNRPADPEYALPTETWREHVARRGRCLELRAKLARGEVTEINDLITYNLDIVQFTRDVIERCEGPELLRALWKALASVTVLDPTCGSGAFLFAALRILEPLYEACLLRMAAFVADFDREGYTQRGPDFREVLAQVAEHANRGYFIRKAIILSNLYGVDIMEEAVEIAKLRLFLSLVARAETMDRIEPLPDIDFNIRPGNTLVGFATFAEAERAVSGNLIWFQQMAQLKQDAADLDRLFALFREQQTTHGGRVTKADKDELRRRLAALGDTLDRFLAAEYGIDEHHYPNKADYEAKLAAWRASHQPFHWFVEFYGIVQARGGFDVIIGNPPYVEKSKFKNSGYTAHGFVTEQCSDIYGMFVERGLRLIDRVGTFGVIIPISMACTDDFGPLQELVLAQPRPKWLAHFANRPAQLFEGAQKRLTIITIGSGVLSDTRLYTTRYCRWFKEERDALAQLIKYVEQTRMPQVFNHSIAKVGSPVEVSCVRKALSSRTRLGSYLVESSAWRSYYVRTPGYFCQFFVAPPMVREVNSGLERPRGELYSDAYPDRRQLYVGLAALNSALFNWYLFAYSDCRHMNRRDVLNFPFDMGSLNDGMLGTLVGLSERLQTDFQAHKTSMRKSGLVIETFDASESKPIIDEIDRVLAEHYGFSDEELDFIINYDIKYRMGAESGEGDGGEG